MIRGLAISPLDPDGLVQRVSEREIGDRETERQTEAEQYRERERESERERERETERSGDTRRNVRVFSALSSSVILNSCS